jgi:hypothetical protein
MSEIIISDKLDEVSPSFCLAKWNMVSLHLTNGKTHSCYHNPTHDIPVEGLQENPGLLHNTERKIIERKEMREGIRPKGCEYCWKIEDSGHKSDRHYRSSENWNLPDFDKIAYGDLDETITPAYIEVNFNQACNFKCMYCSPHLSTTWEDEIKKYGPYKVNGIEHNNIIALERGGLMPKKTSQKENPYVQAFWKWWPEVYPNLKIFRMTGGEPLMDKNTFKVLDYVREHPNSDLELSVTSNMCPPTQDLFEKFLGKIKEIEKIQIWHDPNKFNPNSGNYHYVSPAIKHLLMFISVDSVGKQAEYMRTGLDFDRLHSNLLKLLDETNGCTVTFINTFNLLSIPNLRGFLEWVLELRQRYSHSNQRKIELQVPASDGRKHPNFVRPKTQKIMFDIPLLRSPIWFNIRLGNNNEYLLNTMKENIHFMEQNKTKGNFTGFEDWEIDKLRRNLDFMTDPMTDEQRNDVGKTFVEYVDEMDRRRGTSFKDTFPELIELYEAYKNDT